VKPFLRSDVLYTEPDMKRFFLAFPLLALSVAFAQYKMETAAGVPADLPPAFASLLQKEGVKVVGSNGEPWAEVWFRNTAPSGPKSAEAEVVLPTIPHGAFLGVIRFPSNGADRRGQTIKPGVYTMRYSNYPVNGDHLGVAPQRDFAVLVPIADDADPNTTPGFDDLMKMSRKASGTPHPAVLSLSSPSEAPAAPKLVQEGHSDWAVNAKMGDLAVSLIVVGRAEG
jgi:hypothetical protein